MYSYKRYFDVVLFCVPLTGKYYVDGLFQEKTPTWWGYVIVLSSTTRHIILTWEIDGTAHKFSRRSNLPFGDRAAWQFFSIQYTAENPTGFEPTGTEVKTTTWDRDGIIVLQEPTTAPSGSYQLVGDSYTMFKLDTSSSNSEYLTGMVYKIQFYNTLNDGNPENPRDLFVNMHGNSYFLYFNFEDSGQTDYKDNSIRRWVLINFII